MNLLLSIFMLMAVAIPLEWTASPDPRTTGYVLVWGKASRVYDHSIDVKGVTRFDLDGLMAGTNYVSCYAYGGGLTSDFCNELLIVEKRPAPPTNTRILGPEFQSVIASWDPNPEPDIIGYRVYHALNNPTDFLPVIGTSSTNVVIPGILIGSTNWFYGTALNPYGESDPCTPVQYIASP